MINAQEWLNSKFPTLEDKRQAKSLSLYGTSGTDRANLAPNFMPVFYNLNLSGELEIKDFANVGSIYIQGLEISKIKLENVPNLTVFDAVSCNNLATIEGLENCFKLIHAHASNIKLFTHLEAWKKDLEQLKAQLAEYEREETSDSSEPLNTKIQRKKAELQTALTSGRRSTAPLRKEIELLEKIFQSENKVKDLETKETEYQRQIQTKEVAITEKQTEINRLKDSEKNQSKKIEKLEKQVRDLEAEKSALQEKMLSERKETLKDWEKEKGELNSSLTKLEEQKDTFQKSADYLRETLKGAEKSLEEVKEELKASQEQLSQEQKDKAIAQENHQVELKKRGETYGVVQERNVELEKKLSSASQENIKLVEWISKLEVVSGEGDAFASLKKELENSKATIIDLQEQLNAKKGRSYWWVYLVIGLVGFYLLMN